MSDNLFQTGIRPIIDEYLLKQAQERRDYQDYWSASSAGYCMKKNIFERLKVPYVNEDPRKQRVFTAGHIFHSWIQELTKEAGLSIAQELEVQDDELMIRGHIDDLVLIREYQEASKTGGYTERLILMDYKTQNSRAFSYDRPLSHYHKLQLGTYMYMLRTYEGSPSQSLMTNHWKDLSEARILKISKDDLRQKEQQLLWSDELEKEVKDYWTQLNEHWKTFKDKGTLPDCTCADHEGGFMSSEKYNPFYYEGEPCSTAWLQKSIKEHKEKQIASNS